MAEALSVESLRPVSVLKPSGAEPSDGGRSIWMCSGQGSQFFQMGRDAFEHDSVFREAMERASNHAARWIGLSLTELIYAPRDDRFHPPFDRLLHSNPALICLQTSVAATLRDRGLRPDLVAGYSIGELSAAVIAGEVSLEAALHASIILAEIVEESLPAGGMLAILDDPRITEDLPEVFEGTSLAAINFERHFVVSGRADAIDRAETELARRKMAAQKLPVRFAFHSSRMDPIHDSFISLVTPILGADLTDHCWSAIRQPVDFRATVQSIRPRHDDDVIDLGPSGTLAAFVKYGSIESAPRIFNTVNAFDRCMQNLDAIVAGADR